MYELQAIMIMHLHTILGKALILMVNTKPNDMSKFFEPQPVL